MSQRPDPRAASGPAVPLAACVSAARADAQRFFGTQAPPPWQPRVRRAMRWWLVGALAATTGAAGAIAWQHSSRDLPAAAGVARPVALPTELESPPVPAPAPAAAAQALPTPAPDRPLALIERQADGLWRIELRAHDRRDAAERLASLTGAQLLERPEVLAQTRPVTLRWQGRDAADAWRALLADELSYALDCRHPRACKVWLFDTGVAGATAPVAPDLPPEPPAPAVSE